MLISDPNRAKITKSIIIEDESSQKIQIISTLISANDDQINLRSILHDSISSIRDKIIRIYDFSRDILISINIDECIIPVSFIHNSSQILLLKVSENYQNKDLNNVNTNSVSSLDLMEIRS